MEATSSQFDELTAAHLKGPFFLTQKLLPLMADGGRILNVSTGLTRFAMPGYAAYAAMKGGIEVLTRYQAKELGPRRITVNVLAPGAIETDFGGGHVRDNEDANRLVAGATALGRAGQPDDVGRAATALLLDDGAMSGSTASESRCRAACSPEASRDPKKTSPQDCTLTPVSADPGFRGRVGLSVLVTQCGRNAATILKPPPSTKRYRQACCQVQCRKTRPPETRSPPSVCA